nr:O-antigen polymerase [Bacteroides fluxus]
MNVLIYMVYPLHSEPSMTFFFYCLACFVVGSWCFFKVNRKTNYLDFDVLFIIIYVFTCYISTFFLKEQTLYRALFLGYMFDTDYVNIGNLLSTIGILSYYCGGCSKVNVPIDNSHMLPCVIHTKILSVLLLCFTVLFIAMGGMAYSQSAYLDSAGVFSPLIPYILLLITFVSTVIIVSEFYNKKHHAFYKINKLSIISIGIVLFILLAGGSRSSASFIALPILGIYCMIYKPLNKKQVFGFVTLSVVIMWLIGQVRSGGEASVSNPILLLVDLTVPSRNNYAVYEYVAKYGFTYGTSFVGVFTVIPFLSNFLGLTNGSGELLTHDFFNMNPDYDLIGLGTTIIADIYIAFGCTGVIVLMYLLGKIVKKYTEGAKNNNYYSLVIYAELFSVSVFTVRGYVTTGLRPIIWCLVIAYFVTHYSIKFSAIDK